MADRILEVPRTLRGWFCSVMEEIDNVVLYDHYAKKKEAPAQKAPSKSPKRRGRRK